mgnify:CR=1 FL=1
MSYGFSKFRKTESPVLSARQVDRSGGTLKSEIHGGGRGFTVQVFTPGPMAYLPTEVFKEVRGTAYATCLSTDCCHCIKRERRNTAGSPHAVESDLIVTNIRVSFKLITE